MPKFDRSCLKAVLGIHSYLMMLLTSKADRLFVFMSSTVYMMTICSQVSKLGYEIYCHN